MYSEVAACELRFYKKELRKRSMIRIVLKKSVKSPINLKIQVHIYIYTYIIIKDLSIYIYIERESNMSCIIHRPSMIFPGILRKSRVEFK